MSNSHAIHHIDPIIRNRNDRMKVTVELAEDVPEKSLTQQQFKDECDMNRIVQNAARGIAPRFMQRGVPQFGDFSEVPSLTDAYDVISRAEEAFMNLPAQLRLELGNDPARINEITKDQIERFKLGKALPPSSQPSEASPAAGQAASPAGVPGDQGSPKSSKAGSKKSSSDDQ